MCFAEAVAAYDVAWLEAPILPDDWKGHDRLATASPLPLCGNETLPWRGSFERLAEAGWPISCRTSRLVAVSKRRAVGDIAGIAWL